MSKEPFKSITVIGLVVSLIASIQTGLTLAALLSIFIPLPYPILIGAFCSLIVLVLVLRLYLNLPDRGDQG